MVATRENVSNGGKPTPSTNGEQRCKGASKIDSMMPKMPKHWAAEVAKAAWSTSHVLMAISKQNWVDCSCSQTMYPPSTATNLNLPVHCWLMCVQLNGAAFLHWKIAWVMQAQPMTENRAEKVNNHIIACTISKHNHACCFVCFDSNDSTIFPFLWKWQIPQPMRLRFAISPSEVLQNKPCYRWWEAHQLELVRMTNNWNLRTAFWTASNFSYWLF